MKRKFLTVPLMIGMITISSCSSVSKTEAESQKLDVTNFDSNYTPGSDFYQYATGGWQQKNPLKPEFARYGSFDLLRETNKEHLKTLIEEIAAANNEEGSLAQKIADIYNAGLNADAINERGLADIKPLLEMIAANKNMNDVTSSIAKLAGKGVMPFVYFYVEADPMNSNMNILQTYQGGMTLGNKDYYLNNDENTLKIREGYLKYIEQLFTLAGYPEAQSKTIASDILKFETEIAKGAFSNVELRDPVANYNKMSFEEFANKYNFFDWTTIFAENGAKTPKEINVSQIPFMDNLGKVLSGKSVQNINDYMTFMVLNGFSKYIGDNFYDASFDFYEKLMSGIEAQEARWKRSLAVANGTLGEAIGELYVAKYFPPKAKERMLVLVSDLQESLGNRINNLDWMSEETKVKALEKLSTFTVKIGYPDKWRDYSDLKIDKNMSYVQMIMSSSEFETAYELSKIETPVDKDKWHMNPQTVNAYYSPLTNEICFPAAILQPPFFYIDGDDAINYGAIGVVIGHEMTHGFDDQGRQFDKEGNISDWWTAEDAEQFKKKADVLVSQFDAIKVLGDTHANGQFTLGENIADQGGVLIAYDALKSHLNKNNISVCYDDLDDTKRFFLSYANIWAGNIRDEEILRLTQIDPHSLGRWRVNATLPNIETFYHAFDIKEGDAMYRSPLERVVIW